MSLFKKKCGYCGTKIEKEKEVFKDVKVPGFIGTTKKAFCCLEHTNKYAEEMEEHLKKPRKGRGCC